MRAVLFSRYAVLAVVAACAVSCGADRIESPITASQLCARRDSLALTVLGTNHTPDDDFELMARVLPGGFGGLTTTYMYLKEPALADTVRGTARTLAACPGGTLGDLWAIVQRANVRQGQYHWIELRSWYALLAQSGTGGMYLSDIDEAINRLSYGFATQAALDAFRARAQALGVPVGALDLTVGTPPVALSTSPGA